MSLHGVCAAGVALSVVVVVVVVVVALGAAMSSAARALPTTPNRIAPNVQPTLLPGMIASFAEM
jgi:hypothetical protein